MKIAVLTSSRADYSIYFPLLKELKNDSFFDLSIIAFGTHTSSFHGHTVDQIINDGFNVNHKIESIVIGDSPETINTTLSVTIEKFSKIWSTTNYDLIFSLGDRFEMYAAVLSTLPYNLKVAHLHGGEVTTGAIDNVYRHSISLMSHLHFVSTEQYKSKLISLLGTDKYIYNVGALSVQNILNLQLYTKEEFLDLYKVDLNKQTILCTFHPETIDFEKNIENTKNLILALDALKGYQVLITMPNIDTMGNYIRMELQKFGNNNPNVFLKESLGTKGYLSAMKYCTLILGNSSSGFVEASLFPKKVVNIGQRQNGRIITPNIVNCKIETQEIINAVYFSEKISKLEKVNIYGDGKTAQKIINTIKNIV